MYYGHSTFILTIVHYACCMLVTMCGCVARRQVHALDNVIANNVDTLEPPAVLRAVSDEAPLSEFAATIKAYDEKGAIVHVNKHDLGQLVPVCEPWTPPCSGAVVAADTTVANIDFGSCQVEVVGVHASLEMQDLVSVLLRKLAFSDVPGRRKLITMNHEHLSPQAKTDLDALVTYGVVAAEQNGADLVLGCSKVR